MKVKFVGAAEGVTGSRHLLITEKGLQVLLDCGLYQGMGEETDELNRNIGVNPAELDAVILSHGHIDHAGNLPGLVSQGFTGKIYCTPGTFDVCTALLLDSAYIHESDIRFINKQKRRKGKPEIEPMYTVEDTERCLRQFEPVPYDTDFKLNDELSFYLSGNGHIIGSAAINISANEDGNYTKLTFTGDIGRYADPLLKAPSVFQQADFIICESTYGDRLHEAPDNAEGKLLDIVKRTCIDKKGKLVIPAFSMGRTQEIVFILDKLKNENKLPEIPIFVDSPLSAKATVIVRSHPEGFNEKLTAYIKKDPDPFGFPNLKYIQDKKDSQALNNFEGPCVIISASGMADAGRVKHHLRTTISDPANTVLITGYCAPRTLGAKLVNGEKQVRIFGDLFDVNANVESILSLSAHADYAEMIRYLACQNASRVKTIFLVHGEPEVKEAFREKLLAEGYPKVVIPKRGETYPLT